MAIDDGVQDAMTSRVETFSYGPHPDQVADIAFPASLTGRAPLVLLLHGGFWRAQYDRLHVGVVADALAAAGYVTANVEYRRVGGGGGWPTTLTDVARAVDTLPGVIERERPGRVDHSRIVYLGHSAGGQLALWAALRDRLPSAAPGWIPDAPHAAGVVALAPIVDLAEGFRQDNGRGAVGELLGGGPDDVPERYAAADPAALGAPRVRTVLIHGERDEAVPVEMSRCYRTAHGVELVEPPGADHFDLIDPGSAAWPFVLNALRVLVG